MIRISRSMRASRRLARMSFARRAGRSDGEIRRESCRKTGTTPAARTRWPARSADEVPRLQGDPVEEDRSSEERLETREKAKERALAGACRADDEPRSRPLGSGKARESTRIARRA